MTTADTYKQLFEHIQEAAPGSTVATAVATRIAHARIVRVRVRAGIHGAIILSATIAIVPAIQSFMTSAVRSGFSEYVSLILSDGSYVMGSWKAFGLLMAESAPLLETSVILGLTVIAANSLRRGARYLSHAPYQNPAIA